MTLYWYILWATASVFLARVFTLKEIVCLQCNHCIKFLHVADFEQIQSNMFQKFTRICTERLSKNLLVPGGARRTFCYSLPIENQINTKNSKNGSFATRANQIKAEIEEQHSISDISKNINRLIGLCYPPWNPPLIKS